MWAMGVHGPLFWGVLLPLHPSFGEVTMWVMEVAWAARLGSPPSTSLSQVSLG
jgi:hypothetical protein